MADKNNNARSRRRGVRASRAKLTDALDAAGFKTRAALAEHMAELEGLDAAPRDVVYRVFREQPVDLSTLARVARALRVPLHTLLLSSAEIEEHGTEDPEQPEPTSLPPAEAPAPRKWLWLAAAPVALVGIALLARGFFSDGLLSDDNSPPAPEVAELQDLSDAAIVVRPFEGEAGSALGMELRDALALEARVVLSGTAPPGQESPEIAERLGADIVLDGRVITAGRHAGVQVFAWTEGRRRLVWSATLRAIDLEPERYRALASAIVQAIRQGHNPGDAGSGALPSAQRALIRGRDYLDQERTELNVRRAITSFEAALRDDPGYAEAHAGLCRALVQESLISSEARSLRDAERACTRAAEHAPELRAVRLARAGLDRRTGRLEEAQRIFGVLLEEDPDDVDALLGMAETELSIYRRDADEAAASAAVELANRANAVEPPFWKAPFTLARIHFFTGNVDGAVEAGEAAVAADTNVFSVANLGTSYFCRGDHEKALAQYLLARDIEPEASPGEEQLCVAYYFARDFGNAVASCRAAMEIDGAAGGPAQHEMWGNLADAHHQAGAKEEAADAYARAAELAERKLLVRGNSPNDRAHLAYYYSRLHALDSARVPNEIFRKLEAELIDALEAASDPQAFIRIASALPLFDRLEEARAAYVKGTADCPGFGGSPDLDVLR